jgi:hypothetical protein
MARTKTRQQEALVPKPLVVEPPQYPLVNPGKPFRSPGTMTNNRGPDTSLMTRSARGQTVRDYAAMEQGGWSRQQNLAPMRGQVNEYKPIAKVRLPFRET